MPTITLNKSVFERLVGKKLPLEKLKDRISMLGTDLEKIDGNEIHVEVFPNRPDMLSEQGFARAFSSFINVKTGLRKYDVKKSGFKVFVDKNVTMRPYTACAMVKNLKFTDERIREVMQMQEKLATTHGRNRKKSAYGVYPLTNIKFPIYYTAKNPSKVMFQPLGFNKKIKASEVEKRHPAGLKYKGITKGWKEYPFFIDSDKNVMCMLPFTNSQDTGKIDEQTRDVFIECSGTDLNNVTLALNMFVCMFSEMGGDVFSLDIVYEKGKTITTPNLTPTTMKLDLDYINKRLGLKLSHNEAAKLLGQMGYGVEKLNVLIPAYRADILHKIDLVEDIAIAYGYENFEEEILDSSTIAEEDKFEVFKRKISEILIGLGFIETCSYHLINSQDQTKKMEFDCEHVSLLNPKTEEFNSLRFWLTPCLLNVFKNNKHNEFPQNIFDIGTVFKTSSKTETNVEEPTRVGVGIAHHNANYTEIRQALDYVLQQLNLTGKVVEYEHPSFLNGRTGRCIVGGKKVAIIGEIHPQVLKNFDIEVPVSVFELNLTEIFKLIK